MEVWERKAAQIVNTARTQVRDEQSRLYREVKKTKGRDHRIAELEAIEELLHQAKAHIDTHGLVEWQYQTPLPH